MPYRDDDDEESSLGDSELPDEADMDQDDDEEEDAETIVCDNCHKPFYEQAESCPHCGEFVTSQGSAGRRPLWVVIGLLVCIVVVLLTWLF